MGVEASWEKYLTHTQIKQRGAISNLGDGTRHREVKLSVLNPRHAARSVDPAPDRRAVPMACSKLR